MPDLSASVGRNGQNRSSDVKIVQRLLNRHLDQLTPSRPLLIVDGLVGDKTVTAIIDFQRQVLNFGNPDGRVDPGGRTWAGLQADAEPSGSSPPAETVPRLGQLSEKYETGRRGPGTVSGGSGDAGGVSYGSYQMTSIPNGGTVQRFVSQADFRWRDDFKTLEPGSRPFSTKWQDIAQAEPDAFHAEQHEYIKRTHFDLLVRRIRDERNLDVTQHSHALQDVVWSTAVQHGPRNTIVHESLNSLREQGAMPRIDAAFDRALIQAIYAERGRTNARGVLVYFSRNSEAVQRGVAKRFVDEAKDALAMLAQESF